MVVRSASMLWGRGTATAGGISENYWGEGVNQRLERTCQGNAVVLLPRKGEQLVTEQHLAMLDPLVES